MNDWRIGSLFSGIGGLELGLEWAGLGRTAWQVEQDEFALSILEAHWPEAERFKDVCEVGGANLRPVEVLCGGFPCQDISNANQNANGLEGERSGLWFEFARIIGEMEPRVVVVENVAALLRRGIDRVLGDLASMGYDAEWGCISAASVGAHHRRDRIFIVAYANGLGHVDGRASIFTAEAREQTLLELGRGGSAMADAESLGGQLRGSSEERPRGPSGGGQILGDSNSEGLEGRQEHRLCQDKRPLGPPSRSIPGNWCPEPSVGRVANGIPSRVDRLRCLGNAVVPQVAEYVGGLIVNGLQPMQREAEGGSK